MFKNIEIKAHQEKIRGMVYAALFSSLMAASSLFVIPLGPVPFTLQVMFVLLSGAILGPGWGVASMIIYLMMGLIGLPVFSGGRSGIGHLLGPTGGYLAGFLFASLLVGLLIPERRRFTPIFLSMMAGLVVIYGLGILWLSISARLQILKALAVGLIPFIPADILKAVIASMIVLKTGTIFKESG